MPIFDRIYLSILFNYWSEFFPGKVSFNGSERNVTRSYVETDLGKAGNCELRYEATRCGVRKLFRW